jgi:hypothetical protein
MASHFVCHLATSFIVSVFTGLARFMTCLLQLARRIHVFPFHGIFWHSIHPSCREKYTLLSFMFVGEKKSEHRRMGRKRDVKTY